jgi:hypothetical protein
MDYNGTRIHKCLECNKETEQYPCFIKPTENDRDLILRTSSMGCSPEYPLNDTQELWRCAECDNINPTDTKNAYQCHVAHVLGGSIKKSRPLRK